MYFRNENVKFEKSKLDIKFLNDSLSIRRFWGKRGKMEAKKGES